MRDKDAEVKKTKNKGWRFTPGELVRMWTKTNYGGTWTDVMVVEQFIESYWGEGRPIKWYEDEMYEVLGSEGLKRVHVDSLGAVQSPSVE